MQAGTGLYLTNVERIGLHTAAEVVLDGLVDAAVLLQRAGADLQFGRVAGDRQELDGDLLVLRVARDDFGLEGVLGLLDDVETEPGHRVAGGLVHGVDASVLVGGEGAEPVAGLHFAAGADDGGLAADPKCDRGDQESDKSDPCLHFRTPSLHE